MEKIIDLALTRILSFRPDQKKFWTDHFLSYQAKRLKEPSRQKTYKKKLLAS